MLPKGLLNIVKNALEKKDSGLPQATPLDLARVSYGLAYVVLPDMIHRTFDDFIRHWRDRIPFGFMLCDYGCSKQKVRTTLEQKSSFKTQDGQMSPACDYYLVEFPTPPPFVRPTDEELRAAMTSGGNRPVLAPFFAAVLDERPAGKRRYYILGQSPSGSTTFRTVTADGANCNLGPGPEPTVSAFLQRLREELAS